MFRVVFRGTCAEFFIQISVFLQFFLPSTPVLHNIQTENKVINVHIILLFIFIKNMFIYYSNLQKMVALN